MYLQSLKLLRPKVEKMHLKENTLFDLDTEVKVTQNAAQYHLHHVTYSPVKFEVAMLNGLDVFTNQIKSNQSLFSLSPSTLAT